MFLQGFGIRRMTADPRAVAASVSLGEDSLAAENALPEYIERQKQLIGQTLREPLFAGPRPVAFRGADEAFMFLVRHQVESAGSMTHIQTYARRGLWLGIVTFTALHAEIPATRPDYDAFVKGLNIAPPPQAQQANPAAPSQPGNQQPAG
jgi:hypothetical protein